MGADGGGWPEDPIIYQIYPRSFQDTTGSGEGDLAGITRRLDHVAALGVDAVWISPIFPSPMCDGGYDVADQTAIDPRFGTLDDFDALVTRAHGLGLRVMMDLVFNHTSDTHPWFARSLARDPEYDDYYVWADPRPDGGPPSNWIGYFGLPAWKWFPQRGQYALHQFLPCQPGLNHYNPRVLEELAAICTLWRERGVDGFRFDAVTSFFFDRDHSDNPPADGEDHALIPGPGNNPFTMQRHVHDMLPQDCAAFAGQLRDWSGEDAFLLGEINQGPGSVELARAFSAPGHLDAGYTIDLAERGISRAVLADMLDRREGCRGLAWWLSSHDQPRHVSREGDGSPRDARMLAAFLLALPGPVLLFQGEELGQPQCALSEDQISDPFDRMYWPDAPGRTGARTPVAWEAGEGCGFTNGAPWLPVSVPPDGPASVQSDDAGSVLSFYRRAIACRRALGLGTAEIRLLDSAEDIIAAELTAADGGRVGLAVNLSERAAALPFPARCPRLLESARPAARAQIAARTAHWLRL